VLDLGVVEDVNEHEERRERFGNVGFPQTEEFVAKVLSIEFDLGL
jgi:hypothetical protein